MMKKSYLLYFFILPLSIFLNDVFHGLMNLMNLHKLNFIIIEGEGEQKIFVNELLINDGFPIENSAKFSKIQK